MSMKWRRLREATAVATMPALTRAQGDGDQDDVCPLCQGSGVHNLQTCTECDGTGSAMREARESDGSRWSALGESTSGPYWVYTDDPSFEQLREASRTFSADVRKKYAASGVALGDGSFPVPDKDALGRAVQAIGRASDPDAAKRHIIKRARALGATDQLPDDWDDSKEASKGGFGGKKAPLFGKKGDKGKGNKDDDKGDKDKEAEDDKPPWLKESEALAARLTTLEDQAGEFRSLREAKPGSMRSTFSTPVRVQTKDGREGYRVCLIREGKGNDDDDQWYTAEAIQELAESGVCEGMQAYGNHPDLEEEENRPERDVKELVGSYSEVRFAESGGPPRAEGILVPLTTDEHHPRYGWVVTLAEAASRSTAPQPLCGISLYGLSAGDDGSRPDGSYGRVVSLIRPTSGDIVTNAGAGGGFIRQLMESARALRNRKSKELTPMQALQYQKSMREAVKRVREADSDETRQAALEALEALEAETIDNAPNSLEQLREAAPDLVKQLTESAQAEDKGTIEELREENRGLKSTLGRFTDVISVTDALREAEVTDPVEIRHFVGMAQQRGLREATEIKEMVEGERAYDERKLAQMKEALGSNLDDDSDIEGAVPRRPVPVPTDGGMEVLRESNIPLVAAE